MNGLKTTVVRELEALLVRYTALDESLPALRGLRPAADSDDDDSDGGEIGTVQARSGGIRSGGGSGTGAGGRGRADSDDDDEAEWRELCGDQDAAGAEGAG